MSCEEGSSSTDSFDVLDGHIMQNNGFNMRHNGHYQNSNMVIGREGPQTGPLPYLEIAEQPQSRGFRFRYQCEGSSHGGLRGETNSRNQRSYPTVKIHNYRGPAKVSISLVTDEKEPQPHAHELIGKNCKNAVCTIMLNGEDMTVVFQNLGVRHVTKKNVHAILTERILEKMKLNKLYGGLDILSLNNNKNVSESERREAGEQAEKQARTMQLNVVRLCFTAYLIDQNGEFTRRLQPVMSNAIYDSKSPGTAALRIYRMDKCGGCCCGQEEVFLLCDKVQKDDIAVRFFEVDDDGQDRWEAYGVFGPADVHRQFAIVFRTPLYHNCSIMEPVMVKVQLKRMSDGEMSECKDFVYYPKQLDEEEVHKKRKKTLPFSINPGSMHTGYFTGNGGIYNNGMTQTGPLSVNDYASFGHVQPLVSGALGLMSQPFPTLPTYADYQHLTGMGKRVIEMDGSDDSNTDKDDENDSGSSSDSTDSGSDSTDSDDDGTGSDEGESSSAIDDVDGMTDVDLAARMKALEVTGTPATVGNVSSKKYGKKCKKLAATLDGTLAIKMSECRYRALHDYAKTGNISYLLKGQHNLIGVVDGQGDTALHHSVIHTQPSVIDNLLTALSHAPDRLELVNQPNKLKQTPLHVAAFTRQVYAVRALCSHGADPTQTDRNGNTPVHLAVLVGDLATVRALLLDRPDYPPELSCFNYDGYAPLHLAVLHSQLEMVTELLNSRADVNLAEGRSGRTPLHLALEMGKEALATHILLEHSADINQQAFDGNTALHIAVGRHLLHMCSFLISMGADQNIQNFQGEDSDEPEKEDAGKPARRSGLTPRDLAGTDSTMLRVLDGEQCPSLIDKPEDSVQSSSPAEPAKVKDEVPTVATDEKPSTQLIHPHKVEMRSLPAALRQILSQQLADMLDPISPGSDWIALATWMNMSSDDISAARDEASPTMALLQHLENQGCSIAQLEESLRKMEHSAALHMLQRRLSAAGSASSTEAGSSASQGDIKHSTSSTGDDSGFISSI